MIVNRRTARPGLSLIEVIVSLAIFLMALVAMGQLLTLASDQANEVRRQSEALQLCQAKLAEVVAGIEPLQSQGEAPFEDTPDWVWSLEAEPESVPNLWKVTVKVSRADGVMPNTEVSLTQYVFDPAQRGTIGTSSTPPSTTTTTTETTGTGN